MAKTSLFFAVITMSWTIVAISGLRRGEDAVKVEFPPSNSTMFPRMVMVPSLPRLVEFTLCLRLKIESAANVESYIVSYAVGSGPDSNEIILTANMNAPVSIALRVANNLAVLQCPNLSTGVWHDVCLTWMSVTGRVQLFVDEDLCNNEVNGIASGMSVRAGGILVVGQEQDTLGGGFNPSQTLVGEITQLMLWDEVLTSSQIIRVGSCLNKECKSLPCCVEKENKGNVINWLQTNFQYYDGAKTSSTQICK
ncbi:C-reactive protein 1.4-like [Tachypleus tridentatus]|uniref:C-reactive protein 1.4-like n=1 Tax=Tachypleus tridentatus TaxID=6853 RepID=UPI003FD3E051